jgi:hypothetical protein
MWRTHFGRGYRPVIRHYRMNEHGWLEPHHRGRTTHMKVSWSVIIPATPSCNLSLLQGPPRSTIVAVQVALILEQTPKWHPKMLKFNNGD